MKGEILIKQNFLLDASSSDFLPPIYKVIIIHNIQLIQ